MKILLVEDERSLSNSLKEVLVKFKYNVKQAYDGQEAIYYVADEEFDLIIMDIMMPRVNGIEATRKIRAMGKKIPIILLTAKSQLEDKIEGFDSGADDYLSKPFQVKELLARIKALLRRGNDLIDETKFEDISINPNLYSIECNNKKTTLTEKEYMLLDYFIRHKNRYSNDELILDNIWGEDSDFDISVVWVSISNLRKKLLEIGSKIKIELNKGKGYKVNV